MGQVQRTNFKEEDNVNQTELRRYLAVIKRAVSLIEGMMDHDDGGLLEELVGEGTQTSKTITSRPKSISQNPEVDEQARIEAEHKAARKKHLQSLLDIDCWPESVPEHLMAGPTDDDQIKRARAVLDMMLDRSMESLNFLDFGCGEGWVANEALKRGCKLSTGYDITPNDNWEKLDHGAQFTSVYNEIPKNHYDVIFLFDVLDHCFDPEEVMKQVYDCVKGTGVVYVRCHPWTSRHATHLWKKGFNKAYLHLFFTWEEMHSLLGESPMFTRPEKNPIEAYNAWFKPHFNIVKFRPIEEPVSEFFQVPAFKELLANEQGIEMSEIDTYLERMKIQFVDFCLTPK